jgi:membrane protease YdiL (CAAX protease family)
MNIWPWIHIFVAYLIYIGIAILTSIVVRKTAGDLKDMTNRNSPRVLLLGAAANLIAMFAILFLLAFWDKQPISSLGLAFHGPDALAAFGGLIATFLLGTGFILVLKRTKRIQSIEFSQPAKSPVQVGTMILGLGVLVTVVLQEEVLNRGYVTLNLLSIGSMGIILASTAIFVLIHFLTNRANISQVISWIVSGLVLVLSYLLSGSIWVPVILHYATDTNNVLVFNITGQSSIVQTTPAVTEGQRAVFRVIYGLMIATILFMIYGLKFQLG